MLSCLDRYQCCTIHCMRRQTTCAEQGQSVKWKKWELVSHRYKGIQHRAQKRVHACQVLLALCGVLIPTLKAHTRCMHSEQSSLHPVWVV